MSCSLVKSIFCIYCVIKRVFRAPRRYLYERTRLRLWLLVTESRVARLTFLGQISEIWPRFQLFGLKILIGLLDFLAFLP